MQTEYDRKVMESMRVIGARPEQLSIVKMPARLLLSVLHAITFIDRVVESAETLLKTPRIGRIVPEFSRPDLREVIFRAQDAHFNSSFL